MAKSYESAKSLQELVEATHEFYTSNLFWKDAVGNVPKYFVCVESNGAYSFGLSKFCAFRNISMEDYLTKFRHMAKGGRTQRHISWLTGKDWTAREKIDKSIRDSFDSWVLSFFPSYSLENASIIVLKDNATLN